jgi:hypothetical protein
MPSLACADHLQFDSEGGQRIELISNCAYFFVGLG